MHLSVRVSRAVSPLLLAQVAEFALLVTAMSLLGVILYGPQQATVQGNVNGFYFQLLQTTGVINGLYLALIVVYAIPLIYGVSQDVQNTAHKFTPFFDTSSFYIGTYIFVVCIKFGLLGISLIFTVSTLLSLQGPLYNLQFATSIYSLFAAQDANTTLTNAAVVYGALGALLNVELFASVYLLGWTNAVTAIKG